MADQLIDAFIFRGGNRDDRDAEHGLHIVHTDRTAVSGQLVHHVDGEDHRAIELHQLHREIQVPVDIRRVDNIDNACGIFI